MAIIVNGQLVEDNKLIIDEGYYFGYGVFETILVKNRKPLFLKKHLIRLNNGLETIDIQKSITDVEVGRMMDLLGLEDGVLKINVSEHNTVYSQRPVGYKSKDYEDGAILGLSKVQVNPSDPLTYIKSMNYMTKLLQMKNAKLEGYSDVLYMNPMEHICETSVANIFFVKHKRLITPSTESGLLNGVIRQWVIERYDVEVRPIHVDELGSFEGAFITNSVVGLMKVSSIGVHRYYNNDCYQKISDAYQKEINQ